MVPLLVTYKCLQELDKESSFKCDPDKETSRCIVSAIGDHSTLYCIATDLRMWDPECHSDTLGNSSEEMLPSEKCSPSGTAQSNA